MNTKENLIEYARVIGLEINEDDGFENIYEKVTGSTYSNCLKELEEIEKNSMELNTKKYLKEN